MKILETISIVSVCDNHYALLLAALIKSIEDNHQGDEKIDFYIVDDHISTKNKDRINNAINKRTITIYWKPVASCIPDDISIPSDKTNLPLNVYLRLFFPNFIDSAVERVIYFDVDMIVLENITKLWHVDLQGNVIGAVQDQWVQVVSRWGGIANYEQFGLSPDTLYFNSGLMVIDVKKWKEQDVARKVISCTADHIDKVTFADQYGLNVILANKWFKLDPLWNRFSYSEEERPYLIHFTGRKPIYKSYEYRRDYQELFFYYLRKGGWENFKPIGETKRNLKKLKNLLMKTSLFRGKKTR
ncbi:Lipopolysaccharide biosynthesis protein, LPS:glycosyltransferase [bacterium A37T11]|nr:Lipopolysaccharide biosynthesis protein, LPS:glycosyltransferase [bacterium A37T11]